MRKYCVMVLLLCFFGILYSQNLDECIILNYVGDDSIEYWDISRSGFKINKYVYNSQPFLLGMSRKNRKKERWKKEKLYTICLSCDYNYSVVSSEGGCSRHQWLIADRNILRNNLLCNFPDSIQKKIIYSYSEERDSLFQNLIDFENKVYLSDEIYYYPLKDSLFSYVVLENVQYTEQIKRLETILKEKKMLDNVPIREPYSINIFIPILQTNEEKIR